MATGKLSKPIVLFSLLRVQQDWISLLISEFHFGFKDNWSILLVSLL